MDTFSWEELRQWQTAIGAGIGAFLGFISLMGAALFNFWLNRRRDAQLRHEEMVSVAAALYGEILLLRDELATLALAANEHQGRLVQAPDDLRPYDPSKPTIYPALASKLGFLSSDLVVGIASFYSRVEGARMGIDLYLRGMDRTDALNGILWNAEGGVENVKPVLRQVERLASIPQAKDPEH